MQEQENISKDFQELINHCHSAAERLLLEQEEFYSFGAYIDNEGKLTPVGFHDGYEFTLSDTVITGLQVHFEQQLKDKEIRAYAITYDTRVRNERFPEAIDAISIRMTHRDSGKMINFYFPYKLGQEQIDFLRSWGEHAE